MLSSRYAWCTPERFIRLTMRQLNAFIKVIQRDEVTQFYTEIMSYRASRAKEVPSLDEFLQVALKETPKTENVFKPDADKQLEEHALKRLKERQAASGK